MIEKNGYSVLFIEDTDVIRENYVLIFKKYFKDVYGAEDGEVAYKIYKEKKPDILVIDINIPKMTGLELLKKIRTTDQTTRAIMLTAHCDISILLDASELNLIKYLVKPVSKLDLDNALNLAIQHIKNFTTKSNKIINLNSNLYWDMENKELIENGKIISCTKKETEILNILCKNINSVVDYETIMYEVWNNSFDDRLDALKTIIKNLRRKIPKEIIKNIFGVGYKISNKIVE